MSKIIVGLVARKQSGKDTVANALIRYHNYTQLAFADPLREVALGTNPLVSTDPPRYYADVLNEVGYEAAKRDYPEFRRFLQNLGTEGIRSVDPDFWVNKTIDRIHATSSNVVITDVRFPNELALIKELGGATVRVFRPGYSDIEPEHDSEGALDDADTDFIIYNDGPLNLIKERSHILHRCIEFGVPAGDMLGSPLK